MKKIRSSWRAASLAAVVFFASPPLQAQTMVPLLAGSEAFHCGTDEQTAEKVRERHRWAIERAARDPQFAATVRDTPGLRVERSIVVMDTDPVNSLFDHPFDLVGKTVSLRRDDDGGFVASSGPLAYDSDTGPLFHEFERSSDGDWHFVPYQLSSFSFPFGSRTVSELFISSQFRVEVDSPMTAQFYQFSLLEALSVETPVIAPLAQTLAARPDPPEVYVKESADALTITWRTPEASYFGVDVQLRIEPSGDLHFSYHSIRGGNAWGSLLVSTGEEPWRSHRTRLATFSDPEGDVDSRIPASLRAMLDIVEVTLDRIGGTGLLEARIRTRGEIRRTQLTAPLRFQIALGLEENQQLDRVVAQITSGSIDWIRNGTGLSRGSYATWVEGNTLVIRMLQEELISSGPSLWIGVTSQNAAQQFTADAASAIASIDTPAVSTAVRFSSLGTPRRIDGPLVESFTLPEVNVQGVWEQLRAVYGLDPELIDGVAVYQDHPTDIILYAGAYAYSGNPAVSGIRYGWSSLDLPRSPALMHMNLYDFGWNSRADYSVSVINHEFGHRWLYFLAIMENGTPTFNLNPGGGHPAQYVHTPAAFEVYGPADASAMGGANFRDNGDGTFTSPDVLGYFGYSWHELYLMGLASPNEVPPWFYIAESNPPLNISYSPPPGTTVSGIRRNVTIQQVIDAIGPRRPVAAESQRAFRVLFVLLTRDGAAVTPEMIQRMTEHRLGFEKAFSRATGGRGTVMTTFGGEPRRRSVRPSTRTTGSWLGPGAPATAWEGRAE
jgi:hypothetical protein